MFAFKAMFSCLPTLQTLPDQQNLPENILQNINIQEIQYCVNFLPSLYIYIDIQSYLIICLFIDRNYECVLDMEGQAITGDGTIELKGSLFILKLHYFQLKKCPFKVEYITSLK